jgi:hypothetical protein
MKYLQPGKFSAVLAFILLIVVSSSVAQKREPVKKKKSQAEVDNAYSPVNENASFDSDYSSVRAKKETRKAKKLTKKDRNNSYTYNYLKNLDVKKKEFEKRMKQNAREDRKMAREMQKPQYSDPMYFGHKKKPKKRPAGKRKFCKECGIIH